MSGTMKELSNSACIVGVDESDEIGILPNKSQLALHLEAITNAVRDAGPQGQGRGRHLHRRPALPVAPRRGPRDHAPLRGRHHRGRLLLHHDGRPRRGRAASRPLRRGGGLPRRVGALRRGRHPQPGHQPLRPVRDPLRLRGRAHLLRHDHHAPHARARHHARAVGAGGGVHAEVGGAQSQGAQPRAHHGGRRARLASGLLPVQPAQYLPRHRCRRRGGPHPRGPGQGLREERPSTCAAPARPPST